MAPDQQARCDELHGLMGVLPERDLAIGTRLVAVEERDGYVLEKLMLDLNGLEGVPGWTGR